MPGAEDLSRAPEGAMAPRLEGVEHVLPVRIYYEDTDAAGIVYHTGYLRFAERARTEMVRALGFDLGALTACYRLAFAVRHCTADFIAPARLDDRLEVRSRLVGLRGASFTVAQSVHSGQAELVRMRVRLACVAADGRPVCLPAPVHGVFARVLDGATAAGGGIAGSGSEPAGSTVK
jgi:acyl-CoA thioester hydrolase